MSTISLPTPRYYTALDPYYYEADNRPLVDLAARDQIAVDAVQASTASQDVLAAASGFVARGYTAANVAVGKLSYPGGLTFQIDRAFLTQETMISASDMRTYPRIALAENAQVFNLSAPAINFYRTFTIQAKIDFPDGTLPFFDTSISSSYYAKVIGKITWSIKQSISDQTDFSNLTYPSADAGQIEALHIAVPGGSAQVTQSQISLVNFLIEGSLGVASSGGSSAPTYQYLHDQKIIASASNTINAVGVNCLYAFIFVDGVITFGVSRNSVSSVTFDEVLPVGTKVDFITTVGGQAVSAQGTQTVQTFTAGNGGQAVFTGVTILTPAIIVFVAGIYQNPDSYTFDSGLGVLTFNTPVTQGLEVVLLTLTGLPSAQATLPGGVASQVLTKVSSNPNDFTWRDPIFTFPGGTTGQVLTKVSTTTNDFTWRNIATVNGQCVLTSSGNNVILRPYNGNLISISNVPQEVPLAGVSLNPAALPVGTYGVYAYYDTQLRLEAVNNATTTYEQSASGVFVKVGDPSRTLVGFFYLETAGALLNTSQKRFVRSWFNEQPIILAAPSQKDLPMNAFSPSQYRYITGQIVYLLHLPGDVVDYSSNCTVTTNAGEVAMIALAENKLLGNIPFADASVEMSFGVSPSTQSRSSTAVSEFVSKSAVGVSYMAVYGNENLNSGQVLLSSRFKAIVRRS